MVRKLLSAVRLVTARSTAALAALALLVVVDTAVAAAPGDAPPPRKIPFVVHVMSQCPYGISAEKSVKEMMDVVGAHVDLRLEYIGNVAEDGGLSSMHGPREVAGDLAQVCAQKLTPRWLELVACQNEDAAEVDTNWQPCAERLGIPVAPLRACIEGGEGKRLLAASFEASRAKGVRGSPTFFIDGRRYEGRRRASDFGRAVCGAFGPNPPASCNAFPPPPPVAVTVLEDRRCTECDPARVERSASNLVGNPTLRRVDYTEPEGARLFAAFGAPMLPVLVFDASLDADKEAVAALGPRLRTAGPYRYLSLGDWRPQCVDAGGCARPECSKLLVCQPENPRQLDLYLMSYCPFCAKALRVLPSVLDHLERHGKPIDLRLHFIGTGDEASLASMHGAVEVEEDLREVCAYEHFKKGRRYLEYMRCRADDLRGSDWRTCATSAKLDVVKLEGCAAGPEGKRLLAASFAWSAEVGIGASPTWVANGRHEFNGIDAEAIKGGYCKHNPGKACDAPLPAPPASAP